jgi:hypothetical protein
MQANIYSHLLSVPDIAMPLKIMHTYIGNGRKDISLYESSSCNAITIFCVKQYPSVNTNGRSLDFVHGGAVCQRELGSSAGDARIEATMGWDRKCLSFDIKMVHFGGFLGVKNETFICNLSVLLVQVESMLNAN